MTEQVWDCCILSKRNGAKFHLFIYLFYLLMFLKASGFKNCSLKCLNWTWKPWMNSALRFHCHLHTVNFQVKECQERLVKKISGNIKAWMWRQIRERAGKKGKMYSLPFKLPRIYFVLLLYMFIIKSMSLETKLYVQYVANCREIIQRSGFNGAGKAPTMPSLISSGITLSHRLVT